VPQGSILGPILFDVFIDDLDENALMVDLLIKFANDTIGMKSIYGPEDRRLMQMALDGLLKRTEDLGMQFNKNKCKIMHVGKNNPQYDYRYYMGGIKLSKTTEEKDVGVVIHTRLCEKASNTATAVLGPIPGLRTRICKGSVIFQDPDLDT